MVKSNIAKFREQEWREHPDYNEDETFPWRVELKNIDYVVVGDMRIQLYKWKIKFKEKINNSWRLGVYFFFRHTNDILRFRLAFSEYVKNIHKCRPRSQVEAEKRREWREKKKKIKRMDNKNLLRLHRRK